LAGAGFGRVWEKWPDFGFAGAGAEIRCNPKVNKQVNKKISKGALQKFNGYSGNVQQSHVRKF